MKYITLKNTYAYLLFFGIMLTLFTVTHAEEQAPPIPADAIRTDRAEMERMRGGENTTTNENRGERRAMLASHMQDRIVNLASNVTTRLRAGTERMTNIITRIESRIQKLKAEGVDTSAGEAKLTDAKNALEAVKNTLAELGSVKSAMGSDDFRGSYAPIRIQLFAVRDLLRQTHTLIKETVVLLRNATTSVPQDTNGERTGTSTLLVE